MTIDIPKLGTALADFAASLDIPPSRYKEAVERYEAVGRWLEIQYPGCTDPSLIYVQGSFRLGTVVRPLRGGAEVDYDIDLVCQLAFSKALTTPGNIKALIGNRLKEHKSYAKILDNEGKRCWTLIYANTDGPGFHLDVLPSVPDPQNEQDLTIAITDKIDAGYDWSTSNPKGYGDWFDDKNAESFARVSSAQRLSIQARAPDVFASIEDVPDQLVRTPLQQSVQIMKRHRDVAFDADNSFAPISIIITTLAALFYYDEADVYSALTGIIERLQAHAVLLTQGTVNRSIVAEPIISRTTDGKWYLGNPVNPAENFADRWHEDNHARAKAFFKWVERLHHNFVTLTQRSGPSDLIKQLPISLGVSSIAGLIVLEAVARQSEPTPRIEIPHGPKNWGTS